MQLSNGWTQGNQWRVRLFDDLFADQRQAPNEIFAPVSEVLENSEGYYFYFEMPGVKAGTLNVRIEDGSLIVEAERQRPDYPKEATVHRSERRYGTYRRAYKLPNGAWGQNVTASYHDGVLEVSVPKPETAKPVRIEVKH